MNKLTKIGVSALAGSLAMTAVHAAEGSVSVSTGFAFASTTDENSPTGPYQFDSVVFSASGETEGGITVSAKMELDNDNPGTSSSSNGMDDRSMSFGTDAMGTVSFHGHGGSGVLGQWDDMTPNAYEEIWDTTASADVRIDGRSGNNLITYDSPTINGVMVKAAYQHDHSTAAGQSQDIGHYADFGIMVSPEMVEGLEIGYGFGETEETTGTAIDDSALYVKYTYGSVTVGYQMNESDGPTSATDIDFTAAGITYAVTDDFTIGYSTSESDKASDSDVQEATAIGASYTSGGITVAGSMNSVDNVGYDASADRDGYEFNISFAF